MAQKNYVNNAKLYQEMIEYKRQVEEAKELSKPKPQVSNYIGECILLIANRLSMKPNFMNYSYREEMICDGIENCLMYIDNFNPNKTDNPFAYFTQIIYFAFIRRIGKEKKQMYIKHKSYEHGLVHNTLSEYNEFDDDGMRSSSFDFENQNSAEFIRNFEDNLTKKRKKAKQQGLEKFIGDVDEDSTNN